MRGTVSATDVIQSIGSNTNEGGAGGGAFATCAGSCAAGSVGATVVAVPPSRSVLEQATTSTVDAPIKLMTSFRTVRFSLRDIRANASTWCPSSSERLDS